MAQTKDFPFKMAQAMSFAEAGAPGREISGAWTGPREQIATKKQPSKKTTCFQKVNLIMGLSPIHKDENDRKWIL